MFGHDWEKAKATIIQTRIKPHRGSDPFYGVQEYIADVTTPDGETFRTGIDDPNLMLDFWQPLVGDVVSVEVDPKSRKVKFDKSDPQLSIKARKQASDDGFEQTLAAPPGS
ncbi:MAG TPA: hypothetical protein VGM80_07890 [Gaiellaceae bacterium]|jgi:hypothetical protein